MNKLLVFTAPSGAGKTTIVRHLLKTFDQLAFSVSATTRAKREGEIHGKDYYFLSIDEFHARVEQNAFLEWEEVYDSQFYGTLKSEVSRLWQLGKCIIFDIDVQGAKHIKQIYPDQTLTVFVKPPSLDVLIQRLTHRNTETEATLQRRISKVKTEMAEEHHFDTTLVNDVLEDTLRRAEEMVTQFLS